MKFRINSYNHEQDYFYCTNLKTGKEHRIDFFISGSPIIKNKKADSLIGKVVDAEGIDPYLELASEVFSIEDYKEPTP